MDPSEGINSCSAGDPDVLLGCCKVAPAHHCLERDGGDAFVSVVAGRRGTQAVRIDTTSEVGLVGGFLDASIDG